MLEIIISILAIVLLIKAVSLTFRITWGLAKIVATILLVLAVPIFIVCLILLGGFFLLIPVGLIAAAIGIIKLLT
ncbi:MAG: hypothetical protein J6A97_10230 [Clostridia bacterium]|nr:hypothetical protein [Clostridia bacterium]